jgi:hypothetical protein
MQWDKEFLVPGLEWRPQLAQVIARADVFVFIISPGSLASFAEQSSHPTCAWELNSALEQGIDVVPVLWESSPDIYRLPTAVSNLHWVSFEEYRISGFTDESAFAMAWDRLMLGINGDESTWVDESMEWYDKLDEWREGEYHPDFLLTEDEMRKFENFLRRTPPSCAHILDHPLMTRFIRVNRGKWKSSGGLRH